MSESADLQRKPIVNTEQLKFMMTSTSKYDGNEFYTKIKMLKIHMKRYFKYGTSTVQVVIIIIISFISDILAHRTQKKIQNRTNIMA